MSGGQFPGMAFNQQMTVPRVLTLRSTEEGVRLFIEPVKELEALRGTPHSWSDVGLQATTTVLENVSGDLFDIEADIEIGNAERVGLDIRGHRVEYLAKEQQLSASVRNRPCR